MKIISFAWTTPALLARRKTVTRRDWCASYGEQFKAGDLVQAYDRSPRFKGKRVGTIRLTEDPRRCPMYEMPDSDYEAEGFAFMADHGVKLHGEVPSREFFHQWRFGPPMWVVRFEIVDLCAIWNPETRAIEFKRLEAT